MVIKINSKPITIAEEEAEERDFDPVYFTVSCMGYLAALWLLDYCCFVFFSVHPLPWISAIGGVVHWLLGILL